MPFVTGRIYKKDMTREAIDPRAGIGPINVTARELARGTRRLLDLVEEGRTLVIIRGSRAIARVEPLPNEFNFSLPPRAEAVQKYAEEESLEIPEDDMQKKVLRAYSDGHICHFERPELRGLDPSKLPLAVVRLELNGLLQRMGYGYRITRKGALVVEQMKRDDPSFGLPDEP